MKAKITFPNPADHADGLDAPKDNKRSSIPSFGKLLMNAPLAPGDIPARQNGLRESGLD